MVTVLRLVADADLANAVCHSESLLQKFYDAQGRSTAFSKLVLYTLLFD